MGRRASVYTGVGGGEANKNDFVSLLDDRPAFTCLERSALNWATPPGTKKAPRSCEYGALVVRACVIAISALVGAGVMRSREVESGCSYDQPCFGWDCSAENGREHIGRCGLCRLTLDEAEHQER